MSNQRAEPGRPRLVLVVDDDLFVGRTVGHVLEAVREVRVEVAGSAEEALGLAAAHRPDLMLLDINMPGMGALELCRRWRASQRLRGVPICLLTGVLRGAGTLEAFEPYATEVISKPPDPKELVAALDRTK